MHLGASLMRVTWAPSWQASEEVLHKVLYDPVGESIYSLSYVPSTHYIYTT